MNIRRGAAGDQVREIQGDLAKKGFSPGSVDGSFGGGTESAVKNFQKANGLVPDGVVDSKTWHALFPDQPIPVSPLASAPLANRCLALTGSFETGKQPPDCFCGITGDFDGQGISFGALQWNLGQGTLQELLKDAFEQHGDICQGIFHEHFDTIRELGIAPRDQQLDFSRSIQTRGLVQEPWQGMLRVLGRTPEFQKIQVQHAQEKFQTGLNLCTEFQLTSERAAALMFDIVTQNGGVGPIVKSQIMADYKSIPNTSPDEVEVAKMRSIANRRAAVSKPAFVDDVRRRKLTIAEGVGTVHGISYDLQDTFAISLKPIS